MNSTSNASGEQDPKPRGNEDILKSLRQLNSCVTLRPVSKDSPNSGSASESSNSNGQNCNKAEPPRKASKGPAPPLPSSTSIPKEVAAPSKDNVTNESQPEWLKKWTQRCSSISFKRNDSEGGAAHNPVENGPSDSESEDEESSRENSRESFNHSRSNSPEGNKKPNFRCSKCQAPFSSQPEFLRHFISCNKLSGSKSSNESSPAPVISKPNLPSGISISSSSVSTLKQGQSSVSVSKPKQPPPVSLKPPAQHAPITALKQPPVAPKQSVKQPTAIQLPTSITAVLKRTQPTAPSPPSSENSYSHSPPTSPNLFDQKSPSPPLQQETETSFYTPSNQQDNPSTTPVTESAQLTYYNSNSNTSSGEHRPCSAPTAAVRQIFPSNKDLFHPQRRHVGRKSTATNSVVKLPCWICKISYFQSWAHFQDHHLQHVNYDVRVSLDRNSVNNPSSNLDNNSEDSDNSRNSNSSGNCYNPSSEKGLKLTFKISRVKKRGRGRKRRTVEIVNSDGMNEGPQRNEVPEREQQINYPSEEREKMVDDEGNNSNSNERNNLLSNGSADNSQTAAQYNGSALSENSPAHGRSSSAEFEGFDEERIEEFGTATSSEAPSSTYQPQFESFPGDWFSEYESGPRIAAALAGSSEGGNAGNEYNSPNANSVGKDLPTNSNRGDGLFSQEILGGEQNTSNDQRQGSFEQLCLNDSYNQGQHSSNMGHSSSGGSGQQVPYHNQDGQGSGDLLSELEYLNSSQQMNQSGVAATHGVDMPHTNSHRSNSSTPNSVGQTPTPPSDTSFRALAASPLGSPISPMQTGQTPPLQPGMIMGPGPAPLTVPGQSLTSRTGQTPPLSGSPALQHMSQMGMPPHSSQDTVTTPRLTIANNLMPTTTSPSLTPPMMPTYGQQQWPQTNAPQNYPNNFMQSPTMPAPIRTHSNLPGCYRPSPPPRVRGRPPLMTHPGTRQPMMRGPGRPPGSTMPLLPGPGGRGGMMRHPQGLYGTGQRQSLGQKRGSPQHSQSPSKSLRRDDINVPSRQKDNECQIIAVANRTDGMPVISNVQGGKEDKGSRSAPPPTTTTESTIHLSDSITLSVRPNSQTKETSSRSEKGEAGVVANLLASRGITVTPAAGDKEGSGGGGSGSERRLPSASDLNLSSAISVHPPTSRDRDGFAVPHPPTSRSTAVNSSVDRPVRPPTVDLTQEIPSTGSLGNRFHCSQCDKTFPTQPLLSDHSKVHQQQQQQTRMPYRCHLCTAGFSSQKGQQNHYQQFHQLHLSANDLAIPVVDYRNPENVRRMSGLGVRSFIPLSNLQNRGAGGMLGIPILGLENVQNGQMTLQQWGITDVLTLGPSKTLSAPR